MICAVFFEVLFMLFAGIFGIVMGYRSNNLKIIKSIIFGFILYMIPSAIILGAIYVIGFFNQDVMQLFKSIGEINASAVKTVLIGGILMYVIYDILYCVLGNKILKKGVNVD